MFLRVLSHLNPPPPYLSVRSVYYFMRYNNWWVIYVLYLHLPTPVYCTVCTLYTVQYVLCTTGTVSDDSLNITADGLYSLYSR